MQKIVTLLLISFSLTSCVSTSFYQIYEVVPFSDSEASDNPMTYNENSQLIYEDSNCVVSYDFWGVGGNVGFKLYNKGDQNLYINIDECFFILNGVAFDYYKNRVYSKSNSVSASNSTSSGAAAKISDEYSLYNGVVVSRVNSDQVSSSVGYSISFSEESVVCVPPKSAKFIVEYGVTDLLYRDCDLYKYPKSKQLQTQEFTEINSPFLFGNRISYNVGESDDLVRFENNFYIAAITNYPSKETFDYEDYTYCGQTSYERVAHFKDKAPTRFYIRYSKGTDAWIH